MRECRIKGIYEHILGFECLLSPQSTWQQEVSFASWQVDLIQGLETQRPSAVSLCAIVVKNRAPHLDPVRCPFLTVN